MTRPEVDPAVVELSRQLLDEADALSVQMAARIRAEVPLYADGERVPDDVLVESCGANVRFVLGNLAGSPPTEAVTPSETGAERALQGVPYAAVLQAFRVGGRFLWEVLVEASDESVRGKLLVAAADIWAVTDELSALVTEGYRKALVERARRDNQRRSALLGNLLDDVAAVEVQWESAELLNLPRQGEFAVVAAESPELGEEALVAVDRFLESRGVLSAWRLDPDFQEGLVVLRAGYTLGNLADDLGKVANGRIGVSAVFGSIDLAQHARREARLACASATPGGRDLVRFDEHPMAVLLASTPDWALTYARTILGAVLALPDDDRRVLLETAQTWLLAAGSTSAAAEQLFIHRNTVRYRLQRLEDLTGRNLAQPLDAAEVHIALEAVRILGLN